MQKNMKILLISSVFTLLVMFTAFFFLSSGGFITEFRLKRQSAPIIKRIDEYKMNKGFYPKKLSDTGLPEPDESGPIYYQLQDSNTYIIWFGMELGESVIYDSRTKNWNK